MSVSSLYPELPYDSHCNPENHSLAPSGARRRPKILLEPMLSGGDMKA